MLNTRRVARELALLTMAQLTNRSEKTPPTLEDMLGRAADMLATEARERLQEAAASLVQAEHTLHEKYLEISDTPLKKKDLEESLAAIDKAQQAVELIGSAIELPAMVALADSTEVREFALAQVQRYLDHKTEVDQKLQEAAQNWSVERMASLDRDVLRLAVGELFWAADIPVEVAINEAVELAKKYGTPDSGRFVNGVLSRFADEGAALRGGKPNVV
ncbi:MAG: transcription antitermination factor NusB [Candidatus Sericytochromatia bacterium]